MKLCRWVWRSISISLLLLLSGCGQVKNTLPIMEETMTHPIRVATCDSGGQSVWLERMNAPKRVLVCDLNNVEIMLSWGLGDRIVLAGLESKDITYLREQYPKEFPKVQKIAPREVGIEEALISDPDLIFARRSVFSPKRLHSTKWWKERGVDVYIPLTSNVGDVHTIQDELNYIRDVGKLFDKQEEASRTIADVTGYIERVQRSVSGKSSVRALVLEGKRDKYVVTYDAKWLISDCIRQMGGILATEEKRFGVEHVLSVNPDVIFVEYFDNETKSFAQDLRTNPKYRSLKAVQNDRIYSVPVEIVFMPGIRIKEAVTKIAQGMYPDLEHGGGAVAK